MTPAELALQLQQWKCLAGVLGIALFMAVLLLIGTDGELSKLRREIERLKDRP